VGKPEPKARPYSRWIRKCETELEEESSSGEENGAGGAEEVPFGGAAPSPPAPAPPSLKYQYYQSAEVVTLSVMEKKVQPDELEVDIQERSVLVTVSRPEIEVRFDLLRAWAPFACLACPVVSVGSSYLKRAIS